MMTNPHIASGAKAQRNAKAKAIYGAVGGMVLNALIIIFFILVTIALFGVATPRDKVGLIAMAIISVGSCLKGFAMALRDLTKVMKG